MMKYIVCGALLVLLFASSVLGQCEQTLNGVKYNLNPLTKPNGGSYTATDAETYTYHINFCGPVTSPAESCPSGSYSGYQVSANKKVCYGIAASGAPTITQSASGDGLTVTFQAVSSGGGGWTYTRGAIVDMTCKPGTVANVEKSVSEEKKGDDASTYHFKMQSKYACKKGASGKKCALGCVYGVGGLLMTLALVALVLYFVVGIILCKFVWKKEGMEIIPNVEFWKDIPFLLKDGVMFWVDLFQKVTKKGGYTEVTA